MAFSYKDYAESDQVKKLREAVALQEQNKVSPWAGGTYGDAVKQAMDKIQNREKFTYDLNGDALYNQYKNQYMALGKLAMADTMGQAAAMTGGYGNSYAQTVGNQAYQNYLRQLNDRVPELYQLAMNKYQMEGDQLKDQYNMANDQYGREYNEYRDRVSDYNTELARLAEQYNTERNWDYGQYSDAYNRALQLYQLNNSGGGRSSGGGSGNEKKSTSSGLTATQSKNANEILAKIRSGGGINAAQVEKGKMSMNKYYENNIYHFVNIGKITESEALYIARQLGINIK